MHTPTADESGSDRINDGSGTAPKTRGTADNRGAAKRLRSQMQERGDSVQPPPPAKLNAIGKADERGAGGGAPRIGNVTGNGCAEVSNRGGGSGGGGGGGVSGGNNDALSSDGAVASSSACGMDRSVLRPSEEGAPSCVCGLQAEATAVLFLGTGSAEPSKYRCVCVCAYMCLMCVYQCPPFFFHVAMFFTDVCFHPSAQGWQRDPAEAARHDG
jgi:hypothetical protein